MPRSSQSLSAHWPAFVALLLPFGVLGVTLAVYQTNLNPGLPILLAGCFTAVVLAARMVWGSGPYYHWGVDVGGCLVLFAAISASRGLDAYLAQRSLFSLFGALGFLVFPTVVIRSSRDWRIVAHGFVFFCAVVSLCAWPPAVGVALKTGSLPYLMGTFVNQDTFSVFPLLGLALGVGLTTTVRKSLFVPYSAQLALLFVTLLATGCRAAVVALVVAIVAFLVVVLVLRGAKHREALKILWALPLLFCLLALPFSNFGLASSKKLTAAATGDSLKNETTRREVYTLAWRSAMERPVFGAGPGCFGLAFQSVRAPDHDRLYVNIAHNDHLEILVELGVPGFLLWVGLVGACLFKAYRLVRSSRRPILASSALAAVIAPTVFALFNFILVARPVMWAEFFVFGLALALPSSRLTYVEPKPIRFLMGAMPLLMFYQVGVFGLHSIRAEALLAEAVVREANLELEMATVLIEKAISLQPKRCSVRLDRERLDKTMFAMFPGLHSYDSRAENLDAARQSSPANISVLLEVADFEVERGDFKKAGEALEAALRQAPYHWVVRDRRLAIAVKMGDLERAADLVLEDAPSALRTRRATTLLISLEAQGKGLGVSRLATLSKKGDRAKEDALALLGSILQACQGGRKWELGAAFADLARTLDSEDFCLVLRLAEFTSKTQGKDAGWRILNKVVEDSDASRKDCYEDLVLAWASGAKNVSPAAVEERLTADLREEPRLIRLRVLLSQKLSEQGEAAAALKLAREGLDFKEDSPQLMAEIGRLYQMVGSKDLALSYYQQAQKLDPKDKDLKAKIRALRRLK